ncbi:hypothetical protein [Thalassospira sp.]|uniref:hypothetical protein n=1 Tax=Thalassospira sp. TaxID=1912094 RepID=UPI003AA9801D
MELKINTLVKSISQMRNALFLAAVIIFGNFMIMSAAADAEVNVSLSKQSDQLAADFCADPAFDTQPCPILPTDIAQFDASFIYRFVGPESQRPFDQFSWQSFIAMTWPLTANGVALPYGQAAHPAKGDVPRWQRLVNRDQLITGEGGVSPFARAEAFCGAGDSPSTSLPPKPADTLLLYAFHQATGDVLVDQAGNYVLYETRLNDVAAGYIRDSQLASFTGRSRRAETGNEISFPMQDPNKQDPGKNADGSGDMSGKEIVGGDRQVLKNVDGHRVGPGATLLKFAWRVLSPDDNPAQFLTRNARLFVPARDSVTRNPFCRDVVVGMIGMHLVQRVVSGNGDRWIWSTFEHVANAPLAANARRPNSFIAKKLFPDGCFAPTGQEPGILQTGNEKNIANLQRFNLFGMAGGINAPLEQAKNRLPPNPDTIMMKTKITGEAATTGAGTMSAVAGSGGETVNQGVVRPALWAEHAPYAVDQTGQAIAPSQIVRCWRVFEGTDKTNTLWHQALAGSVWDNYFLVGTQWIGNGGGAPFGVGEVPRFLSNVALESFIQHQETGTCLGCHSTARSDAGQLSNFTFVLAPAN